MIISDIIKLNLIGYNYNHGAIYSSDEYLFEYHSQFTNCTIQNITSSFFYLLIINVI